jgi:hypothetical protein
VNGVYAEAIEEIGFDDLPADLQDEFEELADEDGLTLDDFWWSIKSGEYQLPRYLDRALTRAVKSHGDTIRDYI